ncbi:hypothetical protein HpCK26_06680 [Helicobacter pylori]
MRNHVRNADIIHSSIQPNRTAKSDDALSTVLVYGENTTKKPLTSQENLLKTQEKAQKNTQEPLSALEQAIAKGLNETEAKEYALSVVKSIPEIIEKGVKVDNNGRIAIEYENIRVGLKNNWKGEKLTNHWIMTSYEKRLENSESLYSSPLITKSEHLLLNSNEPNLNTNALKTQEPLSPLEQDNAEKLAKLESEKLDSGNKIFDFYSDRNFIDFKGVSRLPEITFNASKNTDTDIIHSFIPQARTLKK